MKTLNRIKNPVLFHIVSGVLLLTLNLTVGILLILQWHLETASVAVKSIVKRIR